MNSTRSKRQPAPAKLDTPDWARDLIIYELAPKGFTSPHGRESGTFRSTREKIPYLADLGINGVWLAGHHLCLPRFDHQCWSQYHVVRPDRLDPTLGTRADFRSMIDAFHKHDIKVFLDVETHGVKRFSPLFKQHPDWFTKRSTWGPTNVDYDWFGRHEDLDEWWVKMYTDYVLKDGADGYRVDVDICRPDLFKRIKANCKAGGHPIVVWLETNGYTDGACDFSQRQATLSIQGKGLDPLNILTRNVAKHFSNWFGHYQVTANYSDGTRQFGCSDYDEEMTYYEGFQQPIEIPDKKAMLKVTTLFDPKFEASNEKRRVDDEANYIQLKIENLDPAKRITYFNVSTSGYYDIFWQLGSPNPWYTRVSGMDHLTLYLKPLVPDLQFYSIQLSCHDDEWRGSPPRANPYIAQGSRCLFGYSCLLTPAIPLFFSGEEFNATYKSLLDWPKSKQEGKKNSRELTWLYGAWLQWDELERRKHADMLADVKRLIAIRKQNSDIIHAGTTAKQPDIMPLAYTSDVPVPVPYAMWNASKAIVVAGNMNTKTGAAVSVRIDSIPALRGARSVKVTDLMSQEQRLTAPGRDFDFVVAKDKTPRGGVRVFRLQGTK